MLCGLSVKKTTACTLLVRTRKRPFDHQHVCYIGARYAACTKILGVLDRLYTAAVVVLLLYVGMKASIWLARCILSSAGGVVVSLATRKHFTRASISLASRISYKNEYVLVQQRLDLIVICHERTARGFYVRHQEGYVAERTEI